MTSPAFNVVRGVMVLEEPGTRKTNHDWLNRIDGVASRFVKPTCSRCGFEDYAHGLVNGVLCRNWRRSLGLPRLGLEEKVANIVGRRPENVEALGQELKASLGGES